MRKKKNDKKCYIGCFSVSRCQIITIITMRVWVSKMFVMLFCYFLCFCVEYDDALWVLKRTKKKKNWKISSLIFNTFETFNVLYFEQKPKNESLNRNNWTTKIFDVHGHNVKRMYKNKKLFSYMCIIFLFPRIMRIFAYRCYYTF